MSKVKTTTGVEMSHKEYKTLRDGYVLQHPEYAKLAEERSGRLGEGVPSTAGAMEYLAACKAWNESIESVEGRMKVLQTQLEDEFDSKVKP